MDAVNNTHFWSNLFLAKDAIFPTSNQKVFSGPKIEIVFAVSERIP